MRRALQVVLIVAALCVAVTPLPRGVVERVYSRGIYSIIQPRLTRFSNHLAFALFDVTLLAVTVAVLWMWIVRLRSMPRGSAPRTIGGLALDTGSIATLLYFWFLAAWGLNYQREPLRTQLDFQEDRITVNALRELARRDADALNRLYGPAHRAGWPELRETGSSLDEPFDRAQRDLAMTWRAAAGRPKRSLLDFYFKRVAVDGMTDPFFLETLANQSLLPFERPFVVAHEWGHLAGYADESEANFLAWLICLRGGEGGAIQRVDLALRNDRVGSAAGRPWHHGGASTVRAQSRFARDGGPHCQSGEPGGEPRRLCRLRSISEGESRARRRAQLQRGDQAPAGHALQLRRVSRASNPIGRL